jgi:DNA polymerase-3 subunit epsilon
VQQTLDDISPALVDTMFVVVDLETTGGSSSEHRITEIGAVKVRAGEVLGEFQTLVNPATPIPAFIAVLTGITDAMVAGAPSEAEAVPAFLEFAAGSVLVAHNAGFDIGFLKAACTRLGLEWPAPEVLDTVRLARQALTRDEAPNVKLATLARVFRTSVQPNHRALSDARATVDVLHGVMERLGNRGVHTLAELAEWQRSVSPAQRLKRRLADSVPDEAGVYLFRDGQGRVLYVGKSRRLRARVRSYFTSSETRRRMAEMVAIAESVQAVVCTTEIEAEVRELRLIAAHKPPYNRRSKYPERSVWLKLTVEPFPRLSVVTAVRDDGAAYVGPFRHRRLAQAAAEAVYRAVPLRQCTSRLPARPSGTACVLADLGRCGAPCTGEQNVETYAVHAQAVRDALTRDVHPMLSSCEQQMARLASDQRFEEAAAERDRWRALAAAASRTHVLRSLAGLAEVVAARRSDAGGWDVVVVRYGRLAAAGRSPAGIHPQPLIDSLVRTAESVEPAPAPLAAASTEEAEVLLRWLGQDGTRLVSASEPWAVPVAARPAWSLDSAGSRAGAAPATAVA